MLSRIKFDIDNVVERILNKLPENIWTDPAKTFLDPALGGGQFVKAIEQRLKKFGHSDSNIRSRVFGFESSSLNIRFAVNKYNLLGQYEVCDFINRDFGNMKFDIITSNPPYTTGTKGAAPLWQKFIVRSCQLSNTLAFVVPTSLSRSDDYLEIRKMINDNGLLDIEFLPRDTFNADVSTLFFISHPTGDKTKTIWYDNNTFENIIKKIEAKVGKEYYNSQKRLLTFKKVTVSNKKGPVIDNLNVKGYTIINDYVDVNINDHRVCTSYLPNHAHHLMALEYVKPNLGVPGKYRQIKVKSELEGLSLVSYLKSKLSLLIYSLTKTSRTIDGPQTRFIPEVPLTQIWTDELIYKYFDLDQSEINYIERTLNVT
jgi:hypothetical protein